MPPSASNRGSLVRAAAAADDDEESIRGGLSESEVPEESDDQDSDDLSSIPSNVILANPSGTDNDFREVCVKVHIPPSLKCVYWLEGRPSGTGRVP